LNKLESTFGQGEMKQDADCLVGEERGEWKWEVRSSTLQGCWQFAKHGQVIDMSTAARKEKNIPQNRRKQQRSLANLWKCIWQIVLQVKVREVRELLAN